MGNLFQIQNPTLHFFITYNLYFVNFIDGEKFDPEYKGANKPGRGEYCTS